MADTRIYLGRPGALAALRSPRGTFEATRQRRISTFELGLGGAAVDQMIGGARAYTINYEQLTRDDWTTLQVFLDGHEGPGPFALLDPGQRNMLPANIAAATSVTNDTATSVLVGNFVVAGSGCTIASSTAFTDAGPRVLAWTFANAAPGATAALTPAWPSSTFRYGVPVVAGRALCFSCFVRGGGTDAIVTYTPSIVWRDAAGATVGSASAGSATASAAGSWTQLSATGTPPAGAIYADWKIGYTSGVSAGSIAYFRRFMLNEGATPDATWGAGTGVWPVRMVAGAEAWPFLSPELRVGPVVAFVEDVS